MSIRLPPLPLFSARDLAGYKASWIPRDLLAAVVVSFMAVPQAVAYAMIAGLPPVMGLYAATLPVIVGGLFRSSRLVVTGPTNAVSLIVGGAVATAAAAGSDPIAVAITLALLVGIFQVTGGLLRLGAVVDYISSPVVLGYITGAGILIGVGQLPNLTATGGTQGHLFPTLWTWLQGLGATHPLSLGLGLATVVVLAVLRRIDPRIPGALLVMALGIIANLVFGLHALGVREISDIAAVPPGLPRLTLPHFDMLVQLAPLAMAVTVLSLVESTAVARAIALQTRERLDNDAEFVGQGLANVAAAFVGSYPVSGSLARSTLNHQVGAKSRLAGIASGVFLLFALPVAGPLIDHTPVAVLAGLLLMVAWDLVDRPQIQRTMHSILGDRLAFVATLLGTWMLDLDKAIYLGVLISIALFLRRARLLVVRDLAVDRNGRLREVSTEPDQKECFSTCPSIRVIHIEGALFFGAAGELQAALDEATANPAVQVLVVRLKRAQGIDDTTTAVFEAAADRLADQGRHLILVGMRSETMAVLEATGAAEHIGEDHLFPTRPGWFEAMDQALEHALELVCDGHEHDCALEHYLELRKTRRGQGPRVA